MPFKWSNAIFGELWQNFVWSFTGHRGDVLYAFHDLRKVNYRNRIKPDFP